MIGQLLHETYRLEKPIGRGGMGQVYEALHLRLDRKVAIKVLDTSLGTHPEIIERFRREARITGSINHPHIVDVVDFNVTADGMAYIVMELLVGETLKQRLSRKGVFTIEEAASILRQLAFALNAAHDKGIIHRDLKPANIFLCEQGLRDDYVKIVDFGISKLFGSILTQTQATMGTPAYMAPEQALGQASQVTKQSDIFSLGVIAYELLSGELPFHGESPVQTMHKVVYEEPPLLSTVKEDIGEKLARVVDKALMKQPDLRYASASAFWKSFAKAIGRTDTEFREPTEDREQDWSQKLPPVRSPAGADSSPLVADLETVAPAEEKPLLSGESTRLEKKKQTAHSMNASSPAEISTQQSMTPISFIETSRARRNKILIIGGGLVGLLAIVVVVALGGGRRSENDVLSTGKRNPAAFQTVDAASSDTRPESVRAHDAAVVTTPQSTTELHAPVDAKIPDEKRAPSRNLSQKSNIKANKAKPREKPTDPVITEW